MDPVEVAARAGVTLVGQCSGGHIGAFHVILPDGRAGVMKWSEDPAADVRLSWTLAAIGALRQRGYPIPPYEPLVDGAGAWVVLQEAVDGALSDQVSDELVERIVQLSERQAGVADALGPSPGHAPWGEAVMADLTRERPARLLLPERPPVSAASFHDHDAMHLDLHHQNVLQLDGRLHAVIDWEGCRPGDRVYDLVVFAVCLAAAQASDEAKADLWGYIRAWRPPPVVAAYTVLIGLRLIDWSLQPGTPYAPELWLSEVRRQL